MMINAMQLSKARAELDAVVTEIDLMQWHDDWMSSADYAAMSDDDVKFLEAAFERKAQHFAGVAQTATDLQPEHAIL
jgi:hypothetical protein